MTSSRTAQSTSKTALPVSPTPDDFAESARPPSWSSSSSLSSPRSRYGSLRRTNTEPRPGVGSATARPDPPREHRRSPSGSLPRTSSTKTPGGSPTGPLPSSPESPTLLQRRVSFRFPIRVNSDPSTTAESPPPARARTRSPSKREKRRSVSSLGEIPLLLSNLQQSQPPASLDARAVGMS